MTLYVSEEDVSQLVDVEDAISAVEETFTNWGGPGTANMPRQRLPMANGQLNIMAAAAPWRGTFGYKSYFVSGKARQYLVCIFCSETGRLLAMIAASNLGLLRTGATSGLATRLLARPEAHRLALIGSGKQARMQAHAIAAVRSLTEIQVFSRSEVKRKAFADLLGRELGMEVRATDSGPSCVEGADIVTTATTSPEPVVLGKWLSPGTHVNAIGANSASRRELDSEAVLKAGMVVVEDQEQARVEAGEIIDLVAAGRTRWPDTVELGAIVQRKRPSRANEHQITVFKSLGVALADVVFAHAIYQKAVEHHVGTTIHDI